MDVQHKACFYATTKSRGLVKKKCTAKLKAFRHTHVSGLIILTYILSRTISKILWSIGQIFAVNSCASFNALVQGIQDCELWPQETRHRSTAKFEEYLGEYRSDAFITDCGSRPDCSCSSMGTNDWTFPEWQHDGYTFGVVSTLTSINANS